MLLSFLGLKSLFTNFSSSLFFYCVAGVIGRPKLLDRCSPPQLMRQVLDLATGAAHFSGIDYFRSVEAHPPRRGVLTPQRGRGRPRQQFEDPSVVAMEQESIQALELAYLRTLELQALVAVHCDLPQRRPCSNLSSQHSICLG